MKLTANHVKRWLPKRPRVSHKGDNGHLLCIAGSRSMSGAAVLSALGALHAGVGLLTSAMPEGERSIVAGRVVEALTLGLPETPDGHLADGVWEPIRNFVRERKISVVAVGPGLGTGAAVRDLVLRLLAGAQVALVLDADALNVLTLKELRGSHPIVITPHPGEFARLTGVGPAEINKDRIGLATQVAEEAGVICVLKGASTVIAQDRKTFFVNTTGNAAMATGGMGDVLTGVIGSLMAQGIPAFEAACAGVYLHGLAGDLAKRADRGLLASEVANGLPDALRKVGF